MASTTLAQVTTTLVASVTENAADTQNFEAATTVAQIFSGIVFAGLGIWMLVSNGTKLSYIQRASLEKRLATCSAIDTYVALFSAFFNFFQLTEVDDLIIPRASSFVLDFSRPVEWIVTCPMMQVVLVLMGGSRIPEYRRVLMPSLSLAVLLCGTASMLLEGDIRFAFYGVGFAIAMGMFTLNAKQVMEHSNGEENLWLGDSEFRKASMLLIVTWFPFPLWFFISPEGVGLIDNILVIQMGWAFLNILSKFTFIFYIQRVKDNYCNRLKVRRELLGVGGNNQDAPAEALAALGLLPQQNNPLQQQTKSKEKELAAVVIETLTFLGMAQHNDRFLKLLRDAQVTNVPMVEALTKEQSDDLQLPWDLVSALQKRIKVWRMESTDHAEQELEKGEAYYQAHTPVNVPGQVDESGSQSGVDIRQAVARALAGSMRGAGGEGSAEFQQGLQNQLAQVGDMVSMLQQQMEQMNQAQMRRQTEMEGSIQWQLEQVMERSRGGGGGGGNAMGDDRMEHLIAQQNERMEQAMDALGRSMQSKLDSLHASQQRQQAESEASFLQKISQMVQKSTEASSDSLVNSLHAKLDMSQAAHLRQQADMNDSLMHGVEGMINKAMRSGSMGGSADSYESQKQLMDKVEKTIEKALDRQSSSSDIISMKLDKVEGNLMQTFGSMAASKLQSGQPNTSSSTDLERTLQSRVEDLQSVQLRQLEDNLRRKFEDVVDQAITRFEMSVSGIRTGVQGDVNSLARGNDLVAETVRTTSDTQMEGLADLRRVSMMVLEQSSAALEKAQGGMGKMDLLQGTVDTGLGRVLERLGDLSGESPGGWATGGRPVSARDGRGGQWPTQGGSSEGSRRPSASPSASSRYGMQVING
mmetsp:Transcript_96999/g.250882  ORF Transcript_96999/g.250882 Transcript_96999/m.250882 type:complete len:867 (-) Transcript_96999:185-2785(-)